MKKKIMLSLMAVFVLVSLCACGSKTEKKDETKKEVKKTVEVKKEKLEPLSTAIPANAKEYKGASFNLSLPENWTQSEVKDSEMTFVEMSNPGEQNVQSIHISEEKLDEDMKGITHEFFMKEIKNQCEKEEGVTFISNKMCSINGHDAVAMVVDMALEIPVRCEQVYIMKNEKMYTLMFIGDKNGSYDKLLKEAESIFCTLKINK